MSTSSSRRYDLDWLRVIAFGILIFYHVGMFYVSWDWHIKSVHAGPDAEWLMTIVNPWRLSLLFFISGVALRFAADKTPTVSFVKSRTVRLGLPILFGMVLIVAPQSWLQLVESGAFSGGFAAFYPQYLDLKSDFSITTPTWNHLWYVVYLLAYTLILIPLAGPVSRFMAGRGGDVTRALFAGRFGPLLVLAVPVLPLIAIRIALTPYFPETHAFWGDWATHARSFTMVVLGFVLAKDDAFWSAIRRAGPVALVLAAALITALSLIWLQWDALAEQGHWIIWPARIARIIYVWLAIAALAALAQRYLNRPSPALTYMTEAIFPWYILHQTLIVMAGFWLTRIGFEPLTEFALVTLCTVGGCLLLHELVIRRVAFLRPLFGLKPKPKAQKSAVFAE